MTEVYILIALWCSSPTGMRLLASEVDNCREKALKCIIMNKKLAFETNNAIIDECISKVKLDDN